MESARFTIREASRITGLTAGQISQLVMRDLLPVADDAPGRGGTRTFSLVELLAARVGGEYTQHGMQWKAVGLILRSICDRTLTDIRRKPVLVVTASRTVAFRRDEPVKIPREGALFATDLLGAVDLAERQAANVLAKRKHK